VANRFSIRPRQIICWFLREISPRWLSLNSLFQSLPKLDQSPLPALQGYLPTDGLVPNSQRYVIGPESWRR